MGTKLQELRGGCFSRAMDDEPMFVLLARDESTVPLVLAWAQNRELEVRKGRRPASDMAQVQEARDTARRMEAWRASNDDAWKVGLFGVPEGGRHDAGITEPHRGREQDG